MGVYGTNSFLNNASANAPVELISMIPVSPRIQGSVKDEPLQSEGNSTGDLSATERSLAAWPVSCQLKEELNNVGSKISSRHAD